jgi:SAM-dependent methyltransferase
MALFLANWAENMHVDSALEIGYGTGLFTEIYLPKISVKNLYLNDLYVSSFEPLQQAVKIIGDAKHIPFPSINLLLSSATLHWITDFPYFIEKTHKALQADGVMLFSIFTAGSFAEIEPFVAGINYKSMQELLQLLTPYFDVVQQEECTFVSSFENTFQAFRYFQHIGANSLVKQKSLFALRQADIHQLTHKAGFFYLKKK